MAGWLWWRCCYGPDLPFLTEREPAEWILYPTPPNTGTNKGELHSTFRKSFSLEQTPSTARLRVRAFRQCEIHLNDQLVELPRGERDHWKQTKAVEISKYLRAGKNEIVVTVSNRRGPPVLWLALDAAEAGWSLETDTAWDASIMGSVWRPARLASEPLDRSNFYPRTNSGDASSRPGGPARAIDGPAERSTEALLNRLPTLLLFITIATTLWLLGWRINKSHTRSWQDPRLVVMAVAALWIVLLINNLGLMDRRVGFDAIQHLAYIQFILDEKTLPLADQGWEMFQPPLYYLVSALLLGISGLSTADDGGLLLLGAIPLVAGVAHFALVFASLRLLFPDHPRRQIAGTLFAAFLPAHLYINHYVSNESLAAVMASASIYLALRILCRTEPPLVPVETGLPGSAGTKTACATTVPGAAHLSRAHIGLGVCLGLALLTKVTALIVVVTILAALAGRLVLDKEYGPKVWARTLGVTVLAGLIVCGWHYVRVWARFGSPIVGNWESSLGFNWWMDPGYHMLGYYTRFGCALIEPLYSSFNGFADSIYSTFWGDGLYGAIGQPRFRPPWNYELVAAGYLLSILPSLAILAGVIAAAIGFVRRPRAEWFLLLGSAFLLGFALLYMTVKLPFYAQAKAFYILSVMVPVCAFTAWGFDLAAGSRRWLQGLLWIALLTWAINVYVSFWIPGGSPETYALRGWARTHAKRHEEALDAYQIALRMNPKHVKARWGLALTLDQLGSPEEASRIYREVLEDHPNDDACHLGLSIALYHLGQIDEAIREAREAIELSPNHRVAYPFLASLLAQKGEKSEAIKMYREALRIRPDNRQVQQALAGLCQ